MGKKPLGIDVLTASRERICYVFDKFQKIYVSFSGGKDSSVMLHLVMEEAIRRSRKVGVMFIDWEVQYSLTIKHVESMFELYKEHIIPYWIAAPLTTNSAISQFEPEWTSWDEKKKDVWVRTPPSYAITDTDLFDFYSNKMTFEEFVPAFGQWYSKGDLTACFVGIRATESLNRYSTMTRSKAMFEDKNWSTWHGKGLYNFYPIYDWQDKDIWTYFGKYYKPYNHLYDLMYKAGVPIHNQRVDELFGSEARRGLWMLQVIEPETWAKTISRISGVNSGGLYCKEKGNVLGNVNISLPKGHTWESFAELLLESMPSKTAQHYRNKFAVYLKWYTDRGYPEGIPDASANDLGQKDVPSWRRICKVLLKNDYWCKSLCFSPTKASYYSKYCQIMKKRRQRWGIYSMI